MALQTRWYLAPYEDVTSQEPTGRPTRRVIVDTLSSSIFGEGGSWAEAECNGVRASGPGWALVKVRAEPATHALIGALPGVKSIPPAITPNTSLGDLTPGQRNGLRAWLNDVGYDDAEIDEKLPNNWQTITLRALFDFLVANSALVAYSGGQWRFGRLQRKSVDALDGQVPG